MSTGADLRYIERTRGEWYYAYQQYPYGETEDYDVIGPFSSQEKAEDHCDDNYPNAGGSWTEPYNEGDPPQELPGEPRKPKRRARSWW